MTDHRSPSLSIAEIGACLERSGYLLESKVVRLLDSSGYFVEPNQVIRDKLTGKSREIDFVAEYYEYTPEFKNIHVMTHFVGEIVNNLYPFVLLTERPRSPNADTESYIKWVTTPENMFYQEPIDFYQGRDPESEHLFSQYCVLTRKNNQTKDWMAHHPDDIYHSLLKMAEYIELQMLDSQERVAELGDKHKRALFWHPLLVLGGELYVAKASKDGSLSIQPTSSEFLEFNWHHGDERRTTVIEVLTVDVLLERMERFVLLDRSLKQQIHQAYADIAP